MSSRKKKPTATAVSPGKKDEDEDDEDMGDKKMVYQASKTALARLKITDKANTDVKTFLDDFEYNDDTMQKCIDGIGKMTAAMEDHFEADFSNMDENGEDFFNTLTTAGGGALVSKHVLGGVQKVAHAVVMMILYSRRRRVDLFPCFIVKNPSKPKVATKLESNLTFAASRLIRK